jgi:hypothetical protein
MLQSRFEIDANQVRAKNTARHQWLFYESAERRPFPPPAFAARAFLLFFVVVVKSR